VRLVSFKRPAILDHGFAILGQGGSGIRHILSDGVRGLLHSQKSSAEKQYRELDNAGRKQAARRRQIGNADENWEEFEVENPAGGTVDPLKGRKSRQNADTELRRIRKPGDAED